MLLSTGHIIAHMVAYEGKEFAVEGYLRAIDNVTKVKGEMKLLNPIGYTSEQIQAYLDSPAHLGFSAYSHHGIFIAFVGIILVLALVGALGVVRESHIVILECKRVRFRRHNVKSDYEV